MQQVFPAAAWVLQLNNIGLYLHTPFCKSKCGYCDFYSYCSDEQEYDRYKDALCKRILFFGERFCRTANTLYLGGGTPSLLGGERLCEIINASKKAFSLNDAEITLEANPADDLAETLKAVAKVGVNRLSLGVQSAIDEELQILGRRHKNADVIKTVADAKAAGIENISCDLMLGIPKQTEKSLDESIDFLLSLDIPHISVYLLKIEEGTPFSKIKNLDFADDDMSSALYLQTAKRLKDAGYEHYEISNFAKKGFESRHNLKYWNLEEYLGIGPAAHSYMNGERFYFDRSSDDFINGKEPIFDGKGGSAEEFLMLSLRLSSGLDEKRLASDFGIEITENYLKFKQKLMLEGLAAETKRGFRLTDNGFLMQNPIVIKILDALGI